jgi:hypothetical protein
MMRTLFDRDIRTPTDHLAFRRWPEVEADPLTHGSVSIAAENLDFAFDGDWRAGVDVPSAAVDFCVVAPDGFATLVAAVVVPGRAGGQRGWVEGEGVASGALADVDLRRVRGECVGVRAADLPQLLDEAARAGADQAERRYRLMRGALDFLSVDAAATVYSAEPVAMAGRAFVVRRAADIAGANALNAAATQRLRASFAEGRAFRLPRWPCK